MGIEVNGINPIEVNSNDPIEADGIDSIEVNGNIRSKPMGTIRLAQCASWAAVDLRDPCMWGQIDHQMLLIY
jgi:hypothetical protein